MGSYKGHILPGVYFFFVGIWHMYNTIRNFARDPKAFKARVWHPVPLPGILRYTELLLVIICTFLEAVLVELLIATHYKPLVHGAIPEEHFNNWEHASMELMFCLFAIAVLISETTSWLPIPEGGQHVIAATAFVEEYLLFYFHSTHHEGAEGQYHELLRIEIGLSLIMSSLAATYPRSFLIDLGGGISVALQGLWLFQTAFSLYGSLIPTGCVLYPDTLHCNGKDDELRAMMLANFQFISHIVIMMVFTVILYAAIVNLTSTPETKQLLVSSDDFDIIFGTDEEKGDGKSKERFENFGLNDFNIPVSLQNEQISVQIRQSSFRLAG